MKTKDLTALDTVYVHQQGGKYGGSLVKAVVLDRATLWESSSLAVKPYTTRLKRAATGATPHKGYSHRDRTGVLVLRVLRPHSRDPVSDEELLAAARSIDLDALAVADDIAVALLATPNLELAAVLPKDLLGTWADHEAGQAAREAEQAEQDERFEAEFNRQQVEAERINDLATELNVRMEHAEAGDTRVGIRRPDMLALLERLAKAEGL